MNDKNRLLVIIVAVAMMVIAFPTFFFFKEGLFSDSNASAVGGQTDESGCLTPAGYSWDADLGVCLRAWEFTDADDRTAVKAVTNLIGSFVGLTAVGTENIGCENCKLVFFERNDIRIGMMVRGGVVEDRLISPLECVARDGTVRDQASELPCERGEYIVGAVGDKDAVKYCCYVRDLESQ